MKPSPESIVQAWINAANNQNEEYVTELSSRDIKFTGPRGTGHGIQLVCDWLFRVGFTLNPKRMFVRDCTVVVEEYGIWHSIDTGELKEENDVA